MGNYAVIQPVLLKWSLKRDKSFYRKLNVFYIEQVVLQSNNVFTASFFET
jgi:hypothetical protein